MKKIIRLFIPLLFLTGCSNNRYIECKNDSDTLINVYYDSNKRITKEITVFKYSNNEDSNNNYQKSKELCDLYKKNMKNTIKKCKIKNDNKSNIITINYTSKYNVKLNNYIKKLEDKNFICTKKH